MQVGFVTTKAADRWFLGRLEKPRSLDVEPFPAALHVPTEHLHPPGLLLLLLPPLPTVARGRRSITRLLLRYVVPRESTAVTHTWPGEPAPCSLTENHEPTTLKLKSPKEGLKLRPSPALCRVPREHRCDSYMAIGQENQPHAASQKTMNRLRSS